MQNLTKYEAELRIEELKKQHGAIELEMINLALEHDIKLYIEGLGRLLLEDHDWTGKTRGEWYTSTDSCS